MNNDFEKTDNERFFINSTEINISADSIIKRPSLEADEVDRKITAVCRKIILASQNNVKGELR